MTTFTVHFNVDSAAFGDDPSSEASRILHLVAEKVWRGNLEGVCIDANGNAVGDFTYNENEDGRSS